MPNKVFLDCGAYDGCSAIKFLSRYPKAKVISFEPNPDLWKYHKNLPNTLIPEAVYTYSGMINFILDESDGDGSSVINEKPVDWNHNIPNDRCLQFRVPCIDIVDVLDWYTKPDDEIYLKLDIEGAEYGVLERMVENGTINRVHKLFCEFHWKKCGFPESRHNNLLSKIKIPIEDWDALDYARHGRSDKTKQNITNLIKTL